jgi:SAM-dependent methyltransferase
VQVRVTKKGAAQVHRGASTPRGAVAAAADEPPAPIARARPQRARPEEATPARPGRPAAGRARISTVDGQVKPSRQDKYRQVEEFLRALDPVLAPVTTLERPVRVVDLGCGNAYLTLAAYRHLTGARGLAVELTGVDVKAQAREHNSAAVERLGWAAAVTFVEGTIAGADVEPADVVLALHACDTATDEALARAVRWQAPVVLAAPCCHHDIQRQLRQGGRVPPGYGPVARHGILRERFADVLTDALRAALLRLHGYRVEAVEFVDSAHTPRNTLLRAVRTGAPASAELTADYAELTAAWGVTPALERLLGRPA